MSPTKNSSPTFRSIMASMATADDDDDDAFAKAHQRVIPVSTRGISWVNNPLSPHKELREKFMRMELWMSADVPPLKVTGTSSCLAAGIRRGRPSPRKLKQQPQAGTATPLAPAASPRSPSRCSPGSCSAAASPEKPPASAQRKVTGASLRLYPDKRVVYRKDTLRDIPQHGSFWAGSLRKQSEAEGGLNGSRSGCDALGRSQASTVDAAEARRKEEDDLFVERYFHRPVQQLQAAADKERTLAQTLQESPARALPAGVHEELYDRLAHDDVTRRRESRYKAAEKAGRRPDHLWRTDYPVWASKSPGGRGVSTLKMTPRQPRPKK